MSSNSGRFCLLRGPKNFPPFDQMPKEYADAWTHWCERPANEYLLFDIWAASLACLTVGLCTRPASVIALLLTVSFHLRIVQTTNGGDSVARCGLFYLMLAPAGAVWSVDAWVMRRWRAWRGAPPAPSPVLIPAWPVRLMQIQLCLIYFFTGLVKIADVLPALFQLIRQLLRWCAGDVNIADVALALFRPARLPKTTTGLQATRSTGC